MEFARERQVEILRALDFDVSEPERRAAQRHRAARFDAATSRARPISSRRSARIAGIEQLPATLPRRRGAYGVLSAEQRMRRRAVDALVGCGLYEVMGWTFSAPEVARRAAPRRR